MAGNKNDKGPGKSGKKPAVQTSTDNSAPPRKKVPSSRKKEADDAIDTEKLIEQAAAADPVENVTTAQRAANIIEASVIQRKAVADAYEAQKTAITEAVEAQRVSAMQHIAQARKRYTAQEAQKKMAQAQDASKNLADMAEGVLVSSDDAPPPPEAAPAASTPPPKEPPYPNGHPGTMPPREDGAMTATAPHDNPSLNPDTPVAQELAKTLRTIISEEIDRQLKALLAMHTGASAPTDDPTEE